MVMYRDIQTFSGKNIDMGKSGIYGIFNLVNGKVYIGSAINLRQRLRQHKIDLSKQKHRNYYLQNAWNKYGENEFDFHVLEHCPKERLLEREQFYLNNLKSFDDEFGYNICPTAGSNFGRKFGDTMRMKVSKARAGKKLSKEHREKISTSLMGRIVTPETRERLSKSNTGKTYPGHKHTEETKIRLSWAHKGKKLSDETKKKLSIANKGKKLTKETIKKLSIALKNHKNRKMIDEKARMRMLERYKNPIERRRSSEILRERYKDPLARQKMSDAIKLMWQKRKNNQIILN